MFYLAARSLFAVSVEYDVRVYGPVHVFDIIKFGFLLGKFTMTFFTNFNCNTVDIIYVNNI